MVNEIYIGTELKFAVNIEAEGFDMTTDDFVIVLKCRSKKITIPKSEVLMDETQQFYIAFDTSIFPPGDLYAITTAYIKDDDFGDGLRSEVDQTKLCKLIKIK